MLFWRRDVIEVSDFSNLLIAFSSLLISASLSIKSNSGIWYDVLPMTKVALAPISSSFSMHLILLALASSRIRLLCFAWTKNAKPFTTESAYRICQCITDDCHIDVYEVLEEFFKIERDSDDRNKKTWYHKRLVQEHEYLTDKYQRKSRAGKKGAEARYSANGNIMAPIPSPIPIPNNKYDVSCD